MTCAKYEGSKIGTPVVMDSLNRSNGLKMRTHKCKSLEELIVCIEDVTCDNYDYGIKTAELALGMRSVHQKRTSVALGHVLSHDEAAIFLYHTKAKALYNCCSYLVILAPTSAKRSRWRLDRQRLWSLAVSARTAKRSSSIP